MLPQASQLRICSYIKCYISEMVQTSAKVTIDENMKSYAIYRMVSFAWVTPSPGFKVTVLFKLQMQKSQKSFISSTSPVLHVSSLFSSIHICRWISTSTLCVPYQMILPAQTVTPSSTHARWWLHRNSRGRFRHQSCRLLVGVPKTSTDKLQRYV